MEVLNVEWGGKDSELKADMDRAKVQGARTRDGCRAEWRYISVV